VNVAYAILADYTMTSKDDKFSIIGIYDKIYAHLFPATHPQLQLAIRIQTTRADFGYERKIMVDLVDGEGHSIQQANGALGLPADLEKPPSMNLVMVFQDTRFPEAGLYQFNVFIEGRLEAEVPLTLEQIPPDFVG
jgi:hypothetical protein